VLFPRRYTRPLEPRADGWPTYSKGYKLIELVHKYWTLPDGSTLRLEPWQQWLICCILETDKGGTLRFSEVVVMVPRQSGKSLIGAVLQLWGLLQHHSGPSVVGLATSVAQANIVYSRVEHAINSNPALGKKLKATGTRGIRHKDGSGALKILAAKADAVQGTPISFGLLDELHILDPLIYSAVRSGTSSMPYALTVGITSQGDDTSSLLIDLSRRGDEAIDDPDTRYGFFAYEATVEMGLTEEAVLASNPRVESGQVPLSNIMDLLKSLPKFDAQRYHLGIRVSNSNVWIEPHLWTKNGGREADAIRDRKAKVWYSVDVSPGWQYASISAARKDPVTGFIECEYVASIVNPGSDQKSLIALCERLPNAAGFIIETYRLKLLAEHLERRGKNVRKVQGGPDNVRIASAFHTLITRHQIRHDRNPVVKSQIENGIAKNVGDGWRIVSADQKKKPIDALMATQYACVAASEEEEKVSQLFTGAA
jgi:phage terminase large subunit-like protein